LNRNVTTVVALGLAQTLAWASSYYLPAMLAAPMARDLGVATPTVFAAFSVALLVSAAIGPRAGRSIDRWGGRPVLIGTNLVFATGLAALGFAQGPVGLFAAWVVLGIGMGSGLYEAAFAALVRLRGHGARNLITGITLFAGFASTVGWPLSTLLEHQVGWRGACFAWAALHLLVGIPLNASLPAAGPLAPHDATRPAAAAAGDDGESTHRRAAILLAVVFAATWFISTAMAAHLPRLLQAGGASLTAAIAAGVLIGPAQVGGRLLEFGVLRRVHPLLSARLAALMHPVGATLLALLGAPVAAVFAILHGAGNGILTIAKGTLPLVLFGPQGYGHRQGVLMVPARIAQALSPWLFGLLLDRFGADALWFSAALGGVAFVALLALRRIEPTRPQADPASAAATP
jgi:predicted MFS family arabinose efflux permease